MSDASSDQTNVTDPTKDDANNIGKPMDPEAHMQDSSGVDEQPAYLGVDPNAEQEESDDPSKGDTADLHAHIRSTNSSIPG